MHALYKAFLSCLCCNFHPLVTFRTAEAESRVRATYCKSLDELLCMSDHVMLVVPLTDETRGMIGARELKLMKPSATLINICRGNHWRHLKDHLRISHNAPWLDMDGYFYFSACAVDKAAQGGSQIRPQLSAASPTNRPQPKVIITILMMLMKLKLWPATGCEAKVAAELSCRP